MGDKKSPKELILQMLEEKACLKQDIFQNTTESFKQLKTALQEVIEEAQDGFGDKDSRVRLEYVDKGDYEAQITVGGDVLLFYMHTNVFKFESTNSLWKTSYLEKDPSIYIISLLTLFVIIDYTTLDI